MEVTAAAPLRAADETSSTEAKLEGTDEAKPYVDVQLVAAGLPECALGEGRIDYGPVIGALWGEVVRLRQRVAALESATL